MTPELLRRSMSKSPFRPFRLLPAVGGESVCDDACNWCIFPFGAYLVLAASREQFTHITANGTAEFVLLDQPGEA